MTGKLHIIRSPAAMAVVAAALAACSGPAGSGSTETPHLASGEVADQPARVVPDAERSLFFGDTHVHSSSSGDAYEDGQTNADIDTTYRFARGLPVIHPRTGARVRIQRPLDFIVVADHAEMLRLTARLAEGDPAVLATPSGRRLKALFDEDPGGVFAQIIAISLHGANQDLLRDFNTPDIRQTAWNTQVDAAERYNEPGKFTAFIGWEWSSTPDSMNLHRVVFTPDGGETARQFIPMSSYDSERPEDLWAFLDQTRARTGADFIAMPHNSNLSNGLMFADRDSNGQRLTAQYARTRMAWEPVVEVTQLKGTSETLPALSPADEFAEFEIRRTLFNNLPAKPEPGSYVRPALLQGLNIESRIGVNPFRFGLIGSSDAHTGLPEPAEDSFLGKSGNDYLPGERPGMDHGAMSAWRVSASGLAAAWAESNTRQAIFDAFRRREVFGTTGPRMSLRVFAGYDFTQADLDARDFARRGYRGGVPMGGELLRSGTDRPPVLMIRAVKDPQGANLDRVQVVKGWRDAAGELHEKVYDVDWSGGRRLKPDGSLPPVGDTVDRSSASYTNSIGAVELATVWRDPDFDPDQQSFYYVRVLEIPTPRHHLFDAAALKIDPSSIDLPEVIQERAYSSPIWYRIN